MGWLVWGWVELHIVVHMGLLQIPNYRHLAISGERQVGIGMDGLMNGLHKWERSVVVLRMASIRIAPPGLPALVATQGGGVLPWHLFLAILFFFFFFFDWHK
jgi:hypothetical protein